MSLLVTGFLVGYGFQSRATQTARSQPTPRPSATSAPTPPLVKGLHSSPDGRLLAFTAVWDSSSRAGVWILDPATGRSHLSPSPRGWQDFVSQWRADGRALLIEREKIPRPVAEAKAGLYETLIDHASLTSSEPKNLVPTLPRGEKLITGTFAPDGSLLLKTRREPKSLFLSQKGQTNLVDRANSTYGQNRVVNENGRTVFYVVRDIPQAKPEEEGKVALFRVVNGLAKQFTPALGDVLWSYVAPSGKWLVVAREDSDNGDTLWTLYKIESNTAREIGNQSVPADAISVYWSPDESQILGTAGEKLWSVSIPALQVRQVGKKSNWNADDATWIGKQNAVALAAKGELWRVDMATGKATSMWKFPTQFRD